jgi:hypothetical protein
MRAFLRAQGFSRFADKFEAYVLAREYSTNEATTTPQIIATPL